MGVTVRGFWDEKADIGWEPRRVSHPGLETGPRQFYDQCPGVDPKTVADLAGHDVKVNLNVYTQTSVDSTSGC